MVDNPTVEGIAIQNISVTLAGRTLIINGQPSQPAAGIALQRAMAAHRNCLNNLRTHKRSMEDVLLKWK